MSYLTTLRTKLPATKASTLLLLLLAVVAVGGLGWWLLFSKGEPSGSRAKTPSSLRRVAQRVAPVPPTPKLQVSDVRQTGQVVELRGSADCDAAVMINGERVPLIFDHCGFKHFVLLPEGPSTIAITAQGSAGGVNTQLIKVTIE